MRDLINWKDQEVQYPYRYTETTLSGGYTQIEPAPGTVRKEGTPQNATNFNTMDLAALEADLIGNENTRMLAQALRDIENNKTKEDAAIEELSGTVETNRETAELGTKEALWIGQENTRLLTQAARDIDGVKGVTIDATLTNSLAYPFNNSQQTLAISPLKNTTGYYIVPEVLETDTGGGGVGEFVISDKLLNGFKIAYTGAAKSVSVRCHVIGGM